MESVTFALSNSNHHRYMKTFIDESLSEGKLPLALMENTLTMPNGMPLNMEACVAVRKRSRYKYGLK
jgi:hypothetical protein